MKPPLVPILPDKALLRRQAARRRAALSAPSRARMAAALPTHLAALLNFCAAFNRGQADSRAAEAPAVFALYYPIGTEIDSLPLLRALQAQGKNAALPAIVKHGRMVFRLLRQGQSLSRGALGFPEPPPSAPVCRPRAVLLPLLAYDVCGSRLGYGGGYYDKALAALRRRGQNPPLIGLAFSAQELPIWQPEPHDIKLHAVLTEKGLRRFKQ